MKLSTFLCLIIITLLVTPAAWALKGRLSTKDDLKLLKKDILSGRIQVGQTRLKKVRDLYGDASKITRNEKRVSYDYGELIIDFEIKRLLRDWTFDYSYGTAYSDEIDDLRDDLQDEQIVGDLITLKSIKKDYEEPTVALETEEDGDHSIYYYGEIKLTFENVIVVSSWKGENLGDTRASMTEDDGVLVTRQPNEIKSKNVERVEVEAEAVQIETSF